MSTTAKLMILVGLVASASACMQPPKGVNQLSEEKRIWVVRSSVKDDAQVFRCADGAGPDQPPKPVCIRAPMVEGQ